MNIPYRLLQCLLLCTVLSAGSASATMPAEEDVLAANSQFYAALNVLFTGNADPMLAVWSHEDDVTYMGPDNSYKVGWNDVSADWIFQANKKLGGKVSPSDIHVVVGQTLAVVTNYEVGQNVDADGKPISVKIRATNTYRKENGQWKMIAHHTDLLPWLSSNQ